jgi:hypothetical protein
MLRGPQREYRAGMAIFQGKVTWALASEKTVRLENEVLVMLVPRTVIGVGIQDQLGIGHILNEVKRIHGVNDDIAISAHDQGGLFDIL